MALGPLKHESNSHLTALYGAHWGKRCTGDMWEHGGVHGVCTAGMQHPCM